jgi:CBS domain containing-hemolysin-like protein
LGLWNLLSEQLASFVSNHFIITLLAVLCSVVLGFLYLAIAYKIFSKRTLTSNRFLFRNQHEESQSAPSSIDKNPAFEYLSTENEEEKDSAEILENALDLYSIEIRECLIPRKEIVAIEITEEIETVKQTFIESKHSKLIVYDGDIDNIVGYVHHSDFYGAPEKIEDLVSDIPTVPESMTALEMLSFFKKKQKSIAWVVDEFGGTAGILTTEDLLEELFGEIEDEHDESEYIEQQISSNEIILSGRLEVEYINEKFNLNIPTDSAETISGYIIEEQNEIPAKDEKIILGSYEYKILKVSKTKIETIRLKVLEE